MTTYYYYKSIPTGQVYKMEEPLPPQARGFEEVHEVDYLEYCRKMGFRP